VCWSTIWEQQQPLLDGVTESKKAYWIEDQFNCVDRYGYLEVHSQQSLVVTISVCIASH
jgi:hypothetical protein